MCLYYNSHGEAAEAVFYLAVDDDFVPIYGGPQPLTRQWLGRWLGPDDRGVRRLAWDVTRMARLIKIAVADLNEHGPWWRRNRYAAAPLPTTPQPKAEDWYSSNGNKETWFAEGRFREWCRVPPSRTYRRPRLGLLGVGSGEKPRGEVLAYEWTDDRGRVAKEAHIRPPDDPLVAIGAESVELLIDHFPDIASRRVFGALAGGAWIGWFRAGSDTPVREEYGALYMFSPGVLNEPLRWAWEARDWRWNGPSGREVRHEYDSNKDGMPDVLLFHVDSPDGAQVESAGRLAVEESWAVNTALIPPEYRVPDQDVWAVPAEQVTIAIPPGADFTPTRHKREQAAVWRRAMGAAAAAVAIGLFVVVRNRRRRRPAPGR